MQAINAIRRKIAFTIVVVISMRFSIFTFSPYMINKSQDKKKAAKGYG